MAKLLIPIINEEEGVTGQCSQYALRHWLSQGWLIQEGWTFPVERDPETGEPLGEPVPLDRSTGLPLEQSAVTDVLSSDQDEDEPGDGDDLDDLEE